MTVRNIFTIMPTTMEEVENLVVAAQDATATGEEEKEMFRMLQDALRNGDDTARANAQTALDMLADAGITPDAADEPEEEPAEEEELIPADDDGDDDTPTTHRERARTERPRKRPEHPAVRDEETQHWLPDWARCRRLSDDWETWLRFFWKLSFIPRLIGWLGYTVFNVVFRSQATPFFLGATLIAIVCLALAKKPEVAPVYVQGLDAAYVNNITGGNLSTDTVNTELMADALRSWYESKPERGADSYAYTDEDGVTYTVDGGAALENAIVNAINRGMTIATESYTPTPFEGFRFVVGETEYTVTDEATFDEAFNALIESISAEIRALSTEGWEMTDAEWKEFIADYLLDFLQSSDEGK